MNGRLVHGRYRPVRTVGRGGEGEVLLALDTVHARPVALKIRDVDPNALAEARVLYGLGPHPSLPLLRDDFVEDGRFYLVFDWIAGTNLAAMLRDRGPLPLDKALTILEDVAAALDDLHGNDPSIVHGDVKPSNVIVRDDGSAVLVDLGLSGRHHARGTRGYAAPELAGGDRTTASDVFGLAATAFAALTGELPRPGAGPARLSRKVAEALASGLAVDPSRRPRRATELIAALRAGYAVKTNLPLNVTAFYGRAHELKQVAELFSKTRIVTLTGPGGMGKTRLALEAARSATRRHPDGVWFIELGSLTDGALVASSATSALDLRESRPRDASATLLDYLVTRRSLLVLDNCEHLASSVARLCEAVLRACPGVRILTTSRRPLRIAGEAVVRVPPLEVLEPSRKLSSDALTSSDAFRLFRDRASLVRPELELSEADVQAVASICHRLDGVPLAIEIAAGRAGTLRVGEIARLISVAAPLGTRGSRTAPRRQQTLRWSIEWSFNLLQPHERTLCSRVWVFAGGFTADAAHKVCPDRNLATEDVRPTLDRLVEWSLVRVDASGRHSQLEAVREYARGLLSDVEQDALRARHAAVYAHLTQTAEPELHGPHQVEWLDRLTLEHDNLRAALVWSSRNDVRTFVRVAAELAAFWNRRGHLTEGARWVTRALKAKPLEPAVRLKLLLGAGGLAHARWELDSATALYQRARTLAARLGDDAAEARAVVSLGVSVSAQGDVPGALRLLEEGQARSLAVGDLWSVVFCLQTLARMASTRGDHDSSMAYLEEALRLGAEVNDSRAHSGTLYNLGLTAVRVGDRERARALQEQSLALRRELGDRQGTAWSLFQLANIAVSDQDTPSARRLLAECVEIGREAGDDLCVQRASQLLRDL